MTTDTPPPCHGLSWLFDATDARSHAEARTICSTCPVIDACRANLRATQKAVMPAYGPEGTWAGVLLKPKQVA